MSSQAWRHLLVISAFGRLREENPELKAVWVTWRDPISKRGWRGERNRK
jgi:hypothetical protein